MVKNGSFENMRQFVQASLWVLAWTALASAAPAGPEPEGQLGIAINYLNQLPDRQKILVWPTWARAYEILGVDHGVSQSVEKYKALGSRPFYLSNFWSSLPQISIVSLGSESDILSDMRANSGQSGLLPYYRDFMSKATVSSDGCTAYRFKSRDTWISVGIIIISQKELLESGHGSLDLCIHGTLDYISGFPVPTEYFDYSRLPDSGVRGLIMSAVGQCAEEGATESQPPETTRDGVTALPSLRCVKGKLSAGVGGLK